MTSASPEGAPELTIDELAAAVGLTVRTVRSYTTRGLLPPPRLRGRTGLYGPEHVARLSAVREMLDAGYTLAAAERVLAAAPTGVTAPGLDVFRALLNPWEPEAPEVVDPAVLAARIGAPLDPERLRRLLDLGVLTERPDGTLEIGHPSLVRAGLQLAGLGIDFDAVLDTQATLTELARQMAQRCVDLFRAQVWQPFVDDGRPPAGWPQVRDAVERALPVASQAVLVTFRQALADAIAAAVAETLAAAQTPSTAETLAAAQTPTAAETLAAAQTPAAPLPTDATTPDTRG